MHEVVSVDKPNSVAGDHLSGLTITCQLERHSQPEPGTTLHTGKDLFVAGLLCSKRIPRGNPEPLGVGVSVVTSILTDDGRYPLPMFRYRGRGSMFGLSSLPTRRQGERSPNLDRVQI